MIFLLKLYKITTVFHAIEMDMAEKEKVQLSDRDVQIVFQANAQSNAKKLTVAEAKAAMKELYLPCNHDLLKEVTTQSNPSCSSSGSRSGAGPERSTHGAGPAVATPQEPLLNTSAAAVDKNEDNVVSENIPIVGFEEFRVLVRHGEHTRRLLFDQIDVNHDGEWSRKLLGIL